MHLESLPTHVQRCQHHEDDADGDSVHAEAPDPRGQPVANAVRLAVDAAHARESVQVAKRADELEVNQLKRCAGSGKVDADELPQVWAHAGEVELTFRRIPTNEHFAGDAQLVHDVCRLLKVRNCFRHHDGLLHRRAHRLRVEPARVVHEQARDRKHPQKQQHIQAEPDM